MASTANVSCVSTEDTIVYSCSVFCIDFMKEWVWSIAVFDQSCFSHTNTTTWHEIKFEELIILETKDEFVFFIDETCWNISDRSRTVDIHWETSIFVISFCFVNNFLDMKCTLSWACKEAFISIIWNVVGLNEASYTCFILPICTFEAFPGLGENVFSNIFCFYFC